jgi:hypothetical protein
VAKLLPCSLLFICHYVAGKSHRRLGRVRELIIDLILARLRREQRRVQRRAGGTYHGSGGGLGSNTKTKLLATALGVAAAAVMAPAALFAGAGTAQPDCDSSYSAGPDPFLDVGCIWSQSTDPLPSPQSLRCVWCSCCVSVYLVAAPGRGGSHRQQNRLATLHRRCSTIAAAWLGAKLYCDARAARFYPAGTNTGNQSRRARSGTGAAVAASMECMTGVRDRRTHRPRQVPRSAVPRHRQARPRAADRVPP